MPKTMAKNPQLREIEPKGNNLIDVTYTRARGNTKTHITANQRITTVRTLRYYYKNTLMHTTCTRNIRPLRVVKREGDHPQDPNRGYPQKIGQKPDIDPEVNLDYTPRLLTEILTTN